MQAYSVVLVTGAPEALQAMRDMLGDHFYTEAHRRNAMMIYDVLESELEGVTNTAAMHNVHVEDARDPYDVPEMQAPPQPVVRHAEATLNLLEGEWYRSNKPEFPLVMVRRIRNRVGTDVYTFDVDLLNKGNLPAPVTLDAETLKSYNLKPAKLDDWAELDIIPPAGFNPDPHAIPDPEVPIAEREGEQPVPERVGASLVKAQIAAVHASERLGQMCAMATVQQLDEGYGVLVRLNARYAADLPREIKGVPVEYRTS